MSRHPTLDIQDKSYTHRIASIVLKANWDDHDWAAIRKLSYSDWKHIMYMVCCALPGFSGLRSITLDWRVPDRCNFLQPTRQQWSPISPYFEYLQGSMPYILIEVLAWQRIPGSFSLRHRKILTTLQTYARHLQSLGTLQHIPVCLPNMRMPPHQWQPYPLRRRRNPFHRLPATSNRLPQRPIISP